MELRGRKFIIINQNLNVRDYIIILTENNL